MHYIPINWLDVSLPEWVGIVCATVPFTAETPQERIPLAAEDSGDEEVYDVSQRRFLLTVAIAAIFLSTSVMALLEPCLPLWLLQTMEPEVSWIDLPSQRFVDFISINSTRTIEWIQIASYYIVGFYWNRFASDGSWVLCLFRTAADIYWRRIFWAVSPIISVAGKQPYSPCFYWAFAAAWYQLLIVAITIALNGSIKCEFFKFKLFGVDQIGPQNINFQTFQNGSRNDELLFMFPDSAGAIHYIFKCPSFRNWSGDRYRWCCARPSVGHSGRQTSHLRSNFRFGSNCSWTSLLLRWGSFDS